ncbi:hypothetical protein KFK09_014745 [Dendrobium nobile]|uniref:Uncharacterized protein n=1 Tax=Dendrobium nobile TaxID=94219 RepID=A0A8T3B3Z0_DENNO|nr:hypothetical protein KFK09_014745 [Dendrobium nobile]
MHISSLLTFTYITLSKTRTNFTFTEMQITFFTKSTTLIFTIFTQNFSNIHFLLLIPTSSLLKAHTKLTLKTYTHQSNLLFTLPHVTFSKITHILLFTF